MKAGFVGVGQMGGPMAVNLASSVEVIAYCRNKSVRQSLAVSGVVTTENLQDVAEADVIFLCLPSANVVEQVLFGADGLADVLRPGTVVVDTSTVEYSTTISISEKLASLDVKFVDAPVSGMRARAEDGTLTVMCGGDQSLVEDLNPLFSSMASKILYMGPIGSGQLTKLINQLLFDINAAALAEILPLAVKLGLDPTKVGDVVNSGTGRSYASEFFIPNVLKGIFDKGYPLEHAYKDLISGAEVSAQHQIPTPVLSAATATYQMALLNGHGAKDKGAMIRVFEDLLNVKFRSDNTEGDSK
ncbi:NAD(P)-dependent oxidoreductase [Enterovibrio sp. ZSDZ42]|uniref:NAD(P)-dependent oxidoreductase n=1 Tax=Enterovibrio gelatinilyticus TaxID=2899819 RepID=A0ABT5QUS4_9GAMM|nr:NAD(P)-dependent oxidoreductase [Enterovibrio sp. ZSDZ42]MDD1791765.1 NAD(P)-dependent oxidoreductase [Enterovibrio sp. ZSDZ42]